MFRKVLIANRGEIAIRVAATLQQMGIRVACVYSDADRRALHVARADEAHRLEGNTSAETYLRGDKILDIARRNGVDAIHPGYGFLSENAGFAQACREAGVTFIGPSPEAMRAAGDKISAKRAAERAGVPTVPGWLGDADDGLKGVFEQAKRIGYPVLIKAASGGGGKGMRVVHEEGELQSSIEAAQREAAAAFGNSRVFLEKYISRPRHIEFQIFGDTQGQIIHLFERECSIQRRHQKILEESPSPVLTPALRDQMGQAAVRLAKTIGYTNAGTVEFMVDEQGAFYFLEVNARLQVEHPVTELRLGHDLVKTQVLVAAGEPLPFRQDELIPNGHAIECRICAEDASRGFLPSIGTIARYAAPSAPCVRVDSGVHRGSEVSVYYDPMLAKLIVWGRTRQEALERMSWALRRFVILGVTTNIDFLQDLIAHPDVHSGRVHTHFLNEHPDIGQHEVHVPTEAIVAAALADRLSKRGSSSNGKQGREVSETESGPWQSAGSWRNG